MSQTQESDDRIEPETKTISGRAVVIGMFLFAMLMTGIMFVYWEYYTRPFRPLQKAIAARYEDSMPLVIGGRYKSHKPGSPMTLRIVVRVPVDPRDDEQRMREQANDLVAIASEYVNMDQYERVEIFLAHRRPEQTTVRWSLEADKDDFPVPTTGELPESAVTSISEGIEGT